MKRFLGIITVTFPDGYIEKCQVKERVDKGKEHFIKTVAEYATIILKHTPHHDKDLKGTVKLTYKGDFLMTIYDLLNKVAEETKNESGSH